MNFSMELLSQASQPNPLIRRRTWRTPSLCGGFTHVSLFAQGRRYGMEPNRNSVVHRILLPPLPCDEQRYNNRYRYNRRRHSDRVSIIVPLLQGQKKEEVLSSFQFRDDVQYEADASLLPYFKAGNMMVGVHICSDYRDKFPACVIATKHFFERSIYFMR